LSPPFLSLCQKSGLITDEHPDWVGKWVYDKTRCLGPEIQVIFFRLRKFYEEETEFGGPTIPQRFDTKAAADAKNVEVRDAVEAELVIQSPKSEAGSFAIIAGDSCLLPCRYMVRNTAYSRVVSTLLKDMAGWLKNDLTSGQYRLGTERRQSGTNSWFVPKLTAAGPTPEAVRNALREKLGV
jgi:hypothetical protein